MTRFLIGIIKFYKKFICPPLEKLFGGGCRFTPTCSEYTIQALERFGTLKGLRLGFERFVRCNPFGGSGYDPIPNLNK